ncbi:hypothetical protein ACFVZH_28045 [Streptomyces sp. NPDC059534]|uniref:hypothetical protein n=1 Tax=Streptomyces sp. NPDC059534 TaxID=3346859 RepID=UPI00368A9A6F
MNHARPTRRSGLLPVLLLSLAATLVVGGVASQAHGGTAAAPTVVTADGPNTDTGPVVGDETHW